MPVSVWLPVGVPDVEALEDGTFGASDPLVRCRGLLVHRFVTAAPLWIFFRF
jgi:hypothetical protein